VYGVGVCLYTNRCYSCIQMRGFKKKLLLERSSRAVLRIIQSKSITGKVNLAWDENNGRISKSCYSLKLIN